MTKPIIGMTIGPDVDLYVSAVEGKLIITPDGETAAILSVEAVDPGPDPIPTPGENLLPNGDLMTPDGRVSFQWWFQEPDYFFAPPLVGPHHPLEGKQAFLALGYKGWWLQADTDLVVKSAWGKVPGSARAWTETVGELGPHKRLFYRAKELAHLVTGVVVETIEGWDPINKRWVQVYNHSGMYGPNTDKRTIPATQVDVEIVLKEGISYPKYRITWDITLLTAADAYLIGDVFLGVA